MLPALVAACALLGLLVGSFLNVVIHRVPAGLSVVRPRSRCPRCDHELRSRDNVPVLSWLVLRGRCRDCSAPISARYPLVELACALVFALLAAAIGWQVELLAFLYLGAVGLALAVIDLDTKRLPDPLVLPSYVVGTALLALAALAEGEWWPLVRGLIGMAVLYALYFVIAVAKPGGMGFGDVKLAGVLGLYLGWVGWGALAVGTFLGFLLGGVVGIALMLGGRATRRTGLPFGPFMLLGALVAILVGERLADAYLGAL